MIIFLTQSKPSFLEFSIKRDNHKYKIYNALDLFRLIMRVCTKDILCEIKRYNNKLKPCFEYTYEDAKEDYKHFSELRKHSGFTQLKLDL